MFAEHRQPNSKAHRIAYNITMGKQWPSSVGPPDSLKKSREKEPE